MPEKDNKPMTIRFAGREIDAHDFVDLAKQKAVQWMDYQQLQGDERTDFINSFNEVLQGIIDNKYEISEFGKIIGLPEEPNYYTKNNGTKKDGEGKWYNKRRVGFNPYGNVETYLNGIARLAKEYQAPVTTSNKKVWKKGMLDTLLGNAVFGEGNNQSFTKNSGQLEAWANQYDPATNGIRPTTGRRQFIIDNVLDPYERDLNSGEYNIDEASLQAELANIANLRKNINNDFELGRIFPRASHYLFTGEKYMTDEQKVKKQQQDDLNTWLNNPDPNAIAPDFVADPSQYAGQRQVNINKSRDNEFNNFRKLGSHTTTDTFIFEQPKTSEGYYYDYKQEDIDKLINLPVSVFLETQASSPSSDQIYTYFNNIGTEIKGKFYHPDWENGDLYIWVKNSNKHTINLNIVDLSSTIKNSQTQNPDLYNYLRQSWNTWKGYESYKNGGVLKAAEGMSVPGVDPDEEQPAIQPKSASAAETSLPKYLTGPQQKSQLPTYITGKPAPWYDNNSPYVWRHYTPYIADVATPEVKNTPQVNKLIPENNETGRQPGTFKTKAKSDYLLDALAWRKGITADYYNQKVLDKMTSLQAVHKVPLRKEYLMHTSKPIEDAIARNNADFNQLGSVQAQGTSDQGDAFARRLAAEKAKADANNPLISKQAEMIMTQSDRALENENNNFANLHEVGESNHAADVALYNYNRQQEAEYYSRQGRQRVSQITEQQKGIAESAQSNFERERNYAVYNNQEYKELEQQIDSCQQNVLSIDAELKELNQQSPKNEALISEKEAERNRLIQQARIYAYKKSALEQRLLKTYDAEHITPYGFAWGLPGTVYQQVPTNPTLSRKSGGKMELAEKEKTKRMYAKMLFDMMKMDMSHMYKQNREAYKDYRKIFMQSK